MFATTAVALMLLVHPSSVQALSPSDGALPMTDGGAADIIGLPVPSGEGPAASGPPTRGGARRAIESQEADGEVPAPTDPSAPPASDALSDRLLGLGGGSAPSESTPLLTRDPCLHCHIHGEIGEPAAEPCRWAILIVGGLLFAFGFVRSAVVWRTRSPWRPLSVRASAALDARYGLAEPLARALAKPVPRSAMHWWYCLGGITALLFAVQAATGMMLALYYQPTPDAAYASIGYIEHEVHFGSAIRAIHQWGANGMIVMCVAHLLRVFISGAYKPPRELTWLSGVLLLTLTLAFGFTGYLLPWDQRAYWATTVGTEIAGTLPVIGKMALLYLRVGWDVTGLTLSRFYALHVIVLPVATISSMGAHFIMIRRQGISRPL